MYRIAYKWRYFIGFQGLIGYLFILSIESYGMGGVTPNFKRRCEPIHGRSTKSSMISKLLKLGVTPPMP